MAVLDNLKIYADVKTGKRLVSVPAASLRALKIWLWRNGYSYKTNRLGEVYNVMIDER